MSGVRAGDRILFVFEDDGVQLEQEYKVLKVSRDGLQLEAYPSRLHGSPPTIWTM